ncbi:CapA family protein [Streptomyces sp. HPF1205]|uniref:CapA family protein n=1 Tax=Streptomyces sp. HPF1205 TaxID=2873262 RepID=UPI001CEC699B|nr:CapA family protein [Streptomyces sp. HPF1205]
MGNAQVTLFLCGDVMLGRGVDQILPSPGDPRLREEYVRDARGYVELAERANGPVPRATGFGWPWGDALGLLERAGVDARIVNLETAITRGGDFAPGKAVHYRMSPGNLPCLTVAHPDVCVLANNHVLDFGPEGLRETLALLADVRLRSAGAGTDAERARRPASVPLPGGSRVLVFARGMRSSGIPYEWAAGEDRPGVAFVPGPSPAAASCVTDRIRQVKRPGDIVVVSLHWGPNWGYEVSGDEVRYARALIDGGADVVHGHSSHHPRPAEIYRGKLILYGCGDFIDDYEGITGYERYRDDLRPAYLVTLDPATGRLTGPGARLAVLQAHRMRLRRAPEEDARWLREVLDAAGRDLGTRVDSGPAGELVLHEG